MSGKKLEYIQVTKELVVDKGGHQPSEEHLKLINKYTLNPVSEEEVVVFPIHAMNDIVDRDWDKFVPDFIERLAIDKKDSGPLGKPFMCSHLRSELAKGRIYLAEPVVIGKDKHLKAWVYLPNTPQYQEFIESVDYGIFWAVSVGIGISKTSCSICNVSWPSHYAMECENNHHKGEKYEKELCFRNLEDYEELYELSSVYLGAQYGAQIVKKMATSESKTINVIRDILVDSDKDAKSKESNTDKDIKAEETPVVNNVTWPVLSQLALAAIKDDKLTETEMDDFAKKYEAYGKDTPWSKQKVMALINEGAKVEVDDEGVWTIDKNSKVWTYDGKRVLRQEVKKVEKKMEELQQELKDAQTERDAFEALVKESKTELGEAKELNKTITSELESTKTELESKGKVVEHYIKGLKGEVLKFYKLSKGDVGEEDIDTSMLVKLLDKCEDDPELIAELKEDFRKSAEKEYPEARRSTVEDGEGIEGKPPKEIETDDTADKLHGGGEE